MILEGYNLKPCVECLGEKQIFQELVNQEFVVRCMTCGAAHGPHRTKERAVHNWNRWNSLDTGSRA